MLSNRLKISESRLVTLVFHRLRWLLSQAKTTDKSVQAWIFAFGTSIILATSVIIFETRTAHNYKRGTDICFIGATFVFVVNNCEYIMPLESMIQLFTTAAYVKFDALLNPCSLITFPSLLPIHLGMWKSAINKCLHSCRTPGGSASSQPIKAIRGFWIKTFELIIHGAIHPNGS